MFFSQSLHRALRAFGLDYTRYTPGTHPLARRKLLLESFGIDLVLDVGANQGQYGTELRNLGYAGRIVSFEPLSRAYTLLSKLASTDAAWETLPFALGAKNGTGLLRVAENYCSSSFLQVLPVHLEHAPKSFQIAEQSVVMQTLDEVFDCVSGNAQNVFLKIDTQGYELQVLAGATQVLERIGTLQVEMSLVPLYENAPVMQPVLEYVTGLGYELVSLEPGVTHASGRLYQVDGIFHRYATS